MTNSENNTLFTLQDELILAPMQNLTSLFFRKSFSKFFPMQFNWAITPFISATKGVISSSKTFEDVNPSKNYGLIPIVPQILGNKAEDILHVAQILEEMGYKEVNLNTGCPKRDIVSHKRGSGLLKEADTIRNIFDSIFTKTNLQLSIKVRLGVKNKEDLRLLLPILNSYPLKSITIHPRTALQQYNGETDLQEFDFLCQNIKHTIIYNGNIFSLSDFNKLKSRFPFINHWMIGRGVLENPFLPSEIRGEKPTNKKNILIKYIISLEKNYSESLLHQNELAILNKMKEFAKYITKGATINATPFLHAQSLNEIISLFQNNL